MACNHNCNYPIGSVSHGTMAPEDLIPDFLWELKNQAGKPHVTRKSRTAAMKTYRAISKRSDSEGYYETEDSDFDLEALVDALEWFAGPYFYFGAHPGDGSDYGYWLSESFDEEFDGLRVNDLSEIPAEYRGEVLVVNDHGNMTLYVKTSRAMREVWAVV